MKIDDLELPIRYDECKGPALDAWNNRKESDDAEPFNSEKIRINFERHKKDFLRSLNTFLK